MVDLMRLSPINGLMASGDPGVWEGFFEVYGHWLSGWFYRQGLPSAEVEELCQETMAVVTAEIGWLENNSNPVEFRSWIRGIVTKRLRRHWDQKGRAKRLAGQVDLGQLVERLGDDDSGISIAWDREHDVLMVSMLLDQLSPRFQSKSLDAFRRIVLEEESAPSVADDLGMSIGAVQVAQHRVLKALHALSPASIE